MLNTGNSGIKIQFGMFEVMLEGISVYKLIFDDKGKVTDSILEYMNHATAESMGLDSGESIGKSIMEIFDSDFIQLYFESVNGFFATGKHNPFEVYYPRTGRYFLISGYSPDYAMYITISNDISQQKKVEKEIIQIKNNWKQTFDAVPDMMAIIDDKFQIVHANKAIAEKFGVTPEECVGLTCYNVVHGTNEPPSYCPHKKLLEDGLERSVEFHEDNLGGDFRVNVSPLHVGGKLIGSVQIVRDVTNRKKTEEYLYESEEKLKIAMDLAKLVYWEYDAGSDLFSFDDQFYKVYGMTTAEGEGLRMSFKEYARRFIPPEELSIVKEKIVEGLKKDDPNFRQVEHSIIRADGEKRFIVVRYGLIKDDNGRMIKSYGASQDITEHKQVEDSLKELIEELKCSNYELEQFAYITSHDLQEPLRAIASFAQLLNRRYKGKLDSDADEFIDFMVDGALRMKEMINGLLDYSRIGTQGEKFRPVDVEKALFNALYNLKISIEENNAIITHNELPTINADSRQMVQLFQNMIGNAIKFRKEDKPLKIHISVAKNEERNEYVFGVSDNGIGIDSEYYDKIFEVFKRLHTMDMYRGTGIGLAIVKKIVERHGGCVWVESELDNGSTFYFTIPSTAQKS